MADATRAFDPSRLPVRRTRKGNVIPAFTRHPKALARVIDLESRPGARFTLEMLLRCADADGRAIISPAEIAHLTPRSGKVKSYSVPTIKRSLRELRDMGLVEWDRVSPLSYYPEVAGRPGRFTTSGGRVFYVNVLALRGQGPLWSRGHPRPPLARHAGTTVRPENDRSGGITSDPPGTITGDPGGAIIGDRPSDPLCLPSEDKMDPAAPKLAASRPAAAREVRAPRANPPVAPGPVQALDKSPSGPPTRPTAARMAGETPDGPAGANASRTGLPGAAASRCEGKGEQDEDQPAKLTRAMMDEGLRKLFPNWDR